jgi:phage gp29-like protein
MSDWATFAEIFGSPFRWVEYDGFDPKMKMELENMMRTQKTSNFAIFQKGTELHTEEQKNTTGSTDLYDRLANFCDRQISKLVLANTMTLDSEGGKYKGDVHEKSEMRVANADKRDIISMLNTEFIRVLGTFGINAEGGYFAFEKDSTSLDDIIKLSGLIDIPAEYLYEQYNIPAPTGDGTKKQGDKSQEAKEKKEEEKKQKEEKKLSENAGTGYWLLDRLASFFDFFAKAPRGRG